MQPIDLTGKVPYFSFARLRTPAKHSSRGQNGWMHMLTGKIILNTDRKVWEDTVMHGQNGEYSTAQGDPGIYSTPVQNVLKQWK